MLNELVDSHAAKEGTVQFAFPETAKTLALQIDKFGAEVKGMPIALPEKR
ncbi:MAG: hypothetical protein U1F33_07005 [Alphaproteobacteria bacterium]